MVTPVREIVLVRITIDTSCTQVPTYQSTDFKDAVRSACSIVLNISIAHIKITDIRCGSIIADVRIENVKNENVTQKLADAVDKNQLNITHNGTQLAVTSVKKLTSEPTSEPTTSEPTGKSDSSDNDDNTALILYIVFGSVLGLAFLIGIIALVVRCRRERSTGMFHLPSEENLELSGFSGQNKSHQRGNFYGEFELEPSEHRVSGIPNESVPATNDLDGDTGNGGSFGVSYLPAWKNLPTMDMSEVSRGDDTNEVNDNLLRMYGKTDGEEGNDSSKTNFAASFDNIGAV